MTLPDLVPLAFETDEGFGARARIGLIVLESDQTIEAEGRLIDLPGVDVYHARIANDLEVTPETLTAMADRLPAAASLLPSEFGFDAIGYGCTSAATLIGSGRVAELIGEAHPGVPSSDPIAAAIASFDALGARRIVVVTPYSADVTRPVAERFARAGIEVVGLGSFLETSDLVVGRISPSSVADAVRTMTATVECDAVFVSCTSVRLLADVANLEAEVGVPVVSSNLALYWHLLRLAGVSDEVPGLGRLMGSGLT